MDSGTPLLTRHCRFHGMGWDTRQIPIHHTRVINLRPLFEERLSQQLALRFWPCLDFTRRKQASKQAGSLTANAYVLLPGPGPASLPACFWTRSMEYTTALHLLICGRWLNSNPSPCMLPACLVQGYDKVSFELADKNLGRCMEVKAEESQFTSLQYSTTLSDQFQSEASVWTVLASSSKLVSKSNSQPPACTGRASWMLEFSKD